MSKVPMEAMVHYCNQYGFIFQGSELYGGLSNTWDYGPLGARLKNNLKDAWRYYFIQTRSNSFELDADILMNPKVWEASGHLSGFNDPLLDCRECKTRHRADNLIGAFDEPAHPDVMTSEEMLSYIRDRRIPCPHCGKSNFTDIRQFNLMFSTQRGVTQDHASTIFLRPENAQGEYVNFLNVLRTARVKLPFGWGEINGTHNRTDYDFRRHQEFSGKNLTYFDEGTGERFLPYVVESTYGVGRTLLALLCEALEEEPLDRGETRQVLRLKPFLAPYKVNVLPLVKKAHGERAAALCAMLRGTL
jgi:glycyl-tRNA synthetase (class II)